MTKTKQPDIDTHFSIITDTATLSIYDPITIEKHNQQNDPSWWIDCLDVEEVQRGEMSLINLQADGHYASRITSTA